MRIKQLHVYFCIRVRVFAAFAVCNLNSYAEIYSFRQLFYIDIEIFKAFYCTWNPSSEMLSVSIEYIRLFTN